MFRRVLLGLRIAVFAGLPLGCLKHLPPAPTPEPVAPAMQPLPPPPGGHGRLVVDVVDGPTPVHNIRMATTPIDHGGGRVSYRISDAPEVLCAASPCVKDVPVGNLLLSFPVLGNPGATEVELVHVGPDPSVYRRALSVYTDNSGGLRVFGIIVTSVGGAAAVTGTALLPIGLAKDNDGLTTAGAISLGAGAAMLAIGIWAIRRDSPTYRPGASNHFPLPATSP